MYRNFLYTDKTSTSFHNYPIFSYKYFLSFNNFLSLCLFLFKIYRYSTVSSCHFKIITFLEKGFAQLSTKLKVRHFTIYYIKYIYGQANIRKYGGHFFSLLFIIMNSETVHKIFVLVSLKT
jgi:hypothetical protein